MRIDITQESEVIETVHYEMRFDRPTIPGEAWYGFPCDATGRVDESKLHPCALDNLRQCRLGSVSGEPVSKGWLSSWTSRYKQPRVGRCRCGREVELSQFTNTCKCGRDFNMSGYELAPRGQWGEETGETAADILRVGLEVCCGEE